MCKVVLSTMSWRIQAGGVLDHYTQALDINNRFDSADSSQKMLSAAELHQTAAKLSQHIILTNLFGHLDYITTVHGLSGVALITTLLNKTVLWQMLEAQFRCRCAFQWLLYQR